MDIGSLRAILSSERAAALSATQADKLSADREKAMNYYQGDMAADMPSDVGRSSAISTDVSDTIDGLMPSLMEVFAGGDEVVQFAPVGPEDVEAAQQETDYVNKVFMQDNPGFMVLYSYIKDALLQKTGVVKVYWEESENEEEETYYDLDNMQFAALVADPVVEVVEHTVKDMPGDPIDAPAGSYN